MNDLQLDLHDATLERELRELFARGPRAASPAAVDRALAVAAASRQRQPRFAVLDRRAWPPRPRSASDPAMHRAVRLAAVALAILLAATILAVGARLLDRPPTLTVTPAGVLDVRSRNDFTLRLWPDGRLLVGHEYLFDLSTGDTERLAVAATPGATPPSVYPLPDGRVVVIHGPGEGEPAVGDRRRVGILDPATGAVTDAGALMPPVFGEAELVLRDGRVVISGGLAGDGSSPGTVLDTAYVFDPRTGTSTPLTDMQQPRLRHVMVELGDGRVLVVGGEAPRSEDAPEAFTTVEVYDLRTGSSTAAGEIALSPGWGPLWPQVALLGDGRVVISGRVDIEEPCGPLPPPSGSPPGLPSVHAVIRLHTHVFDPVAGTLRDGPLVPSSWPGLIPIGGDRVLLSAVQRAYESCALDAKPVEFPWLGIVDFGVDTVFESRNPVTGAGTIDATPDVIYAGGVRLPDGRVAVIEASRETPQPFRIDVLTID